MRKRRGRKKRRKEKERNSKGRKGEESGRKGERKTEVGGTDVGVGRQLSGWVWRKQKRVKRLAGAETEIGGEPQREEGWVVER